MPLSKISKNLMQGNHKKKRFKRNKNEVKQKSMA
jgi:hypothetical protein